MRVLLLFVPVPLVHEEQAGVAIPSALDGAPSGDPQQCGEPSRAPYDVGEAGVATGEYTSLNKRRVWFVGIDLNLSNGFSNLHTPPGHVRCPSHSSICQSNVLLHPGGAVPCVPCV